MSLSKWLLPIRSTFSGLITDEDFGLVERYDEDLTKLSELANRNPIAGRDLLHLKAKLASLGYGGIDVPSSLGGSGRSSLVQMLIQFVSGYYDVDFRDVAHVAHGRMILRKGSPEQQRQWMPRILRGDLIGIAVTEKNGGTTLDSIQTRATKNNDGTWLLSGQKMWISRVNEASAFVVFFKTENNASVSAALINAQTRGITREQFKPTGLNGWSWGLLRFENILFTQADFLGEENQGIDLFREHFLYYRPMVAACALGGAAAVFDNVVKQVREKIDSRTIANCRDSTLEILARDYMAIHSSFLSAMTAQKLISEESPIATIWSRGVKAHGVDAAYRSVSELVVLAGARSYQILDKANKVQRDLQGLLFADGIHDALYRAAGRSLLGIPTK